MMIYVGIFLSWLFYDVHYVYNIIIQCYNTGFTVQILSIGVVYDYEDLPSSVTNVVKYAYSGLPNIFCPFFLEFQLRF